MLDKTKHRKWRTGGDSNVDLNRRQLVMRTGLLGAIALVAPDLLMPGKAQAMHSAGVAWTTDHLSRALTALRDDTMFGLIAFAVPGDDPWSVAQGVTTTTRGGIGTRADLYVASGLDLLVPFPVAFMRQLLDAVGYYLGQTPLAIPDGFRDTLGVPEEWLLEHLDESLDDYLANGVSNSIFASLLLNLVATRLDSESLSGPLLAPFARLAWAEKAEVFSQLESDSSFIKYAIKSRITQPDYRDAVPGALDALTSFMLRISAFGSYCEFAVFDAASKTLRARPLGWALSGYQPDAPPAAEGWDEFKGYYQGRRSV